MGEICYISTNGNDYEEYEIVPGARLFDIALQAGAKTAICALVGGEIMSLDEEPKPGTRISLLSPESSQQASRVFLRGATFLLYCAAKALFPSRALEVEHTLYGGVFCRLGDITVEDINLLESKIYEYIKADGKFTLEIMSVADAKKIMLDEGLFAKAELIAYRPFNYYRLYSFDGRHNYFYGIMPVSARCLYGMRLVPYSDGFILKYPSPYAPASRPVTGQLKYAGVFFQAEKWAHALGASYVANINGMLGNGSIKDFIEVNEALHEKTIASIAQAIIQKSGVRIVLIAGPSSSGKTTFAHRLAVHLRASGRKCRPISVDDYYKNRPDIPLDENGKRDLEALSALDVDKLSDDLNKLLSGDIAELPRYDFITGSRKPESVPLRIDDDLLIIEGIHGLNDGLTKGISADIKFKIFVSPLTTLNIDNHNVVFPDDLRLIRRLVRDKRTRGYSFDQTFDIWDSVRQGEYKYILPYQETADVMFNSTLVYEPLILKKHCYGDLKKFTPGMKNYPEALGLLKFLNYFLSFDDESAIPSQSILREFIGPVK